MQEITAENVYIRKSVLSKNEREWLRANAGYYTSFKEITEVFNKQFGLNKTVPCIETFCRFRLGFSSADVANGTASDKRELLHRTSDFSADEMEWLVGNFRNFSSFTELRQAYVNEFRRYRTTKVVESFCRRKLQFTEDDFLSPGDKAKSVSLYEVDISDRQYVFTQPEIKWLDEHKDEFRNYSEITRAFNREFGTNYASYIINQCCKNCFGHSRMHAKTPQCTAEQLIWLDENISNYTTFVKLTDAYNKQFNCNTETVTIRDWCSRKLHRTKEDLKPYSPKTKPIQIGDRFGRLEVIELNVDKYTKNGTKLGKAVRCRCMECGKELTVYERHLKCGQVTSCGLEHGKLPHDKLFTVKNVYHTRDLLGNKLVAAPELPELAPGLTVAKWELIEDQGDTWKCRNIRQDSIVDVSASTIEKYYPFMKGIRYGHWTITDCIDIDAKHSCTCVCDCGHEQQLTMRKLTTGYNNKCQACGRGYDRNSPEADLMLGQTFGRLTVLHRAPDRPYTGGYHYICRCTCGNITEVRGDRLRLGLTRSCGCLNKDKSHRNDIEPELQNLAYMRNPEYIPPAEAAGAGKQ